MLGLLQPELLDRGIKMGRGNMRPYPVQRCKLFFKRCQNRAHAVVARRGIREIFQGQIPFILR